MSKQSTVSSRQIGTKPIGKVLETGSDSEISVKKINQNVYLLFFSVPKSTVQRYDQM